MQERRPGQPITFQTLYNELPEIENENSEFILDIVLAGKKICQDEGWEPNMTNLLRGSKYAAIREFRPDISKREHLHLYLGLIEPGFEAFRWFPKFARMAGVEINTDRLLDYANPSLLMGMDIKTWDKAIQIIETLPHLSETLRKEEDKKELNIFSQKNGNGIGLSLTNDGETLYIKSVVSQTEEEILRKVNGVSGPEIIETNNGTYVEKINNQTVGQGVFTNKPEILGTALAIALKKTHALGITYNTQDLYVYIDNETGRAFLNNWGNATEENNFGTDIVNAVNTLKNIYSRDTDQMFTSIKAFVKNYTL